MKRIASLFIAVCLLLSTLGVAVACNGSPTVKDAYTVTFDVNYEGGKNRVDTVNAGYRANYYAARRTGYDLVNWYASKDLKDPPFDFTTPINKDYHLYAKWEARGEDVAVTFDFNYENCAAPVTVTGEAGKPIESSSVPDPKRLGYSVEGWYTDAQGTAEWDMEKALTGAVTLYAKYEKTAELKFDENGEVILNNVEADIAITMPSWTGKRGLQEIVDDFNDAYAGKVHLNWVTSYTSEVARFEDPGFTNQYPQNFYRMGELLDFTGIGFDESDYYEAAIRENYVGGSLITYPVGHMTSSIMYNKDMLAELGEEVPETHADFVDVLEKATAKFGAREGYRASLVYENEWQWLEMAKNNIWANNGLSFYSYDRTSKQYVNEFALEKNKEKIENSIKGYLGLFSNPAISRFGEVGWTNRAGFEDVVNGKAFMAVVGFPKMYTVHLTSDARFFDKVGILPMDNFFNYGNIEGAGTFVKGICLTLPNDTAAAFDMEQLAGIALFCDYLRTHSGKLAYNDTFPASKTSQNSEEFLNGQSKYFKALRAMGDPSTFVTLPGHTNEYYFFNYQGTTYAKRMEQVTDPEDPAQLDAVRKFMADDIGTIFH